MGPSIQLWGVPRERGTRLGSYAAVGTPASRPRRQRLRLASCRGGVVLVGADGRTGPRSRQQGQPPAAWRSAAARDLLRNASETEGGNLPGLLSTLEELGGLNAYFLGGLEEELQQLKYPFSTQGHSQGIEDDLVAHTVDDVARRAPRRRPLPSARRCWATSASTQRPRGRPGRSRRCSEGV